MARNYANCSNSMVLVYAFILFLAGFSINLSAKELIEKTIDKHMIDVNKYKERRDVNKLIFKLILINRDI